MVHNDIIDAVDKSIQTLCQEFQTHPTLFYTENDIVCFFYNILRQDLPAPIVKDKDGLEHLLIHGEYPTPFRCDMGGDRFEIKDDTETKFKRGHYDLAILNPDFIKAHSYSVIKAQNYQDYKEQALSNMTSYSPMILYGIEFMFSRDPHQLSKVGDKERGVRGFMVKVRQDTKKLTETKRWNEGFMGQIRMLVFIKGGSSEICRLIGNSFSKQEEVTRCFDENECGDQI